MAGDWIPIRKDLTRCAEVLRIAEATNMSCREVVGTLIDFWAWVDSETATGLIPKINSYGVRILSATCPEFVQSLSDVGWIMFTEDGLEVVNFERWFSASAKRRLQDTRRKQQSRQQVERPHLVRRMSANGADKKRTTEQNRTEQNKDKDMSSKPDVAAVFDYWKEIHGHPRAQLDDKRRRAISARLKQYSVDDLKQAIDGCKASSFHQGANDKHKVFDDIELICRDAQHVEDFIQYQAGVRTDVTPSGNPRITAPG